MTDQPVNGAEGTSGPVGDASPAQDEPPTELLRSAEGESPAADAEVVDGESPADAEVVDGVPVLAEVRTLERATPASLPAVQAAAAAGAGFVAGAATIALVKRRAARKAVRQGRSAPRRAAEMLPIVATRSFLVDVHVIAKNGD